MRMLLSLIFMFALNAQAFQFGTGMSPGMQCPYPYGPSNSAYQGDDQIRNLVGGLANAERKLDRQEQKLRALTAEINAAKSKIKRVIKSANAMAEIERHYKYKANPDDYSPACGRRERSERTASAGGQGANVVHRPSRGAPTGGEEDPGRYAVPSDFCQGGVNDWQHVVAEDGMVLDSICDYEVPLSRNRPDEGRSADCRDGLADFYGKQAKREALEAEVRSLKDKVSHYNEDKERISDQIAEGTYCPYCNSQRRGQNTMGTGNFAMMGVAILGALFNRQPQRPQPQLIAVPRRGPPNAIPYGGFRGGPPQALPFPGPSAYPGRPYAAPIPGYMGVQPGAGPGQGFYGGAPGGIGQGSFGCQGTSPYSFGNPLAPQFQPFPNSQGNAFANPYASDPFAAYGNQNGQHPLLNAGYGPGIAPFLGNGVPGYGQNPNDPFNQYGQNYGAPGALPFPGQGFGQNPLAPYGNAYGGPPGALPYPQNWYPNNGYGNNGYGLNGAPYSLPYTGGYGGGNFGLGGPGVLPYIGPNSAPYASNMPVLGGGYNPSYGAPYMLNPVQNYGYQMNQLRQGVSQIGGGLYGGAAAPAVMPYIGSPTPPPPPNIPTRTPTNGTAPGIVPAR